MDRKLIRPSKGKEKVENTKGYTRAPSPMSISSDDEKYTVYTGSSEGKLMQASFKAAKPYTAYTGPQAKPYTAYTGPQAKPYTAYTGSHQEQFEKEVIQFGNITLPVCFNEKQKFRTMSDLEITNKQQCLLDNLWHIQTAKQATTFKVQCLNALGFYFSEQSYKTPEQKRKFSHYVILRGTKLGIFNKWETVTKYISCPSPIYKGFYNFSEAMKIARERLGLNFYIEPEEVKTFSEVAKINPDMVIKSLENNLRDLQSKNFDLQTKNTKLEKSSLEKDKKN